MKRLFSFLLLLALTAIAVAQTVNVTFEVTVQEGIPSQGHNIFIAGALPPVTNWEQPGTNPNLQMSLKQGTTDVYTITLQLNTGNIEFKFFQASSPSWDGGEWAGNPNRTATISGNCKVTAIWGDQNSTTVTPIVAINEIKNNSFVYPSIASDFINVQAAGNVEIFDLCGKNVLSQKSVMNQAINISNLQSGIYLVKLETKEGIKIQKIFKQ